MAYEVEKTKEEWRMILSDDQYHVLRERGTEPPFTGELLHNQRVGVYKCAACGNDLFSSETKFDSGSGWPSFWAPVSEDHIEYRKDRSHGMTRTEVLCARCGGHLGHVFDDGPRPTNKRFCINSVSLIFEAQR
jgi:peptide-methionine (R)-S-oxide reductase